MISWNEFVAVEPELASFGAALLNKPPAYLATIRKSGAPRVHPVTPIVKDDGLFVYMEPTSPKGRDLRERGWFSLHTSVPDSAGTGGEFAITGHGVAVDDPDRWKAVAAGASYTPAARYVLFELRLTEARCNGYGDVELPAHTRWKATS